MEIVNFNKIQQAEVFARAEQLYCSGKWPEAETLFLKLASAEPVLEKVTFRLGQIARRRGRDAEARRWLAQSLQGSPTAEAHYEMALAQLAGEEVAEALTSLQSVLVLAPEHFGARRVLADLLQATGHWRQAAQHYAALLPKQPKDPILYQNFGFCCQELNELELAEKAYLKTLELGLDSAEIRFNLGLIRMKQGHPKRAIPCFEDALRREPQLTDANLALANAYRQSGDLELAETHLRRELQLNPSCADAAVNLGVVLQEKHQVAEAIACYREAIRLNPHHPVLHWNLAIASLLAGDYQTGWKEYEWRWQVKRKPKPKFSQPEWQGEDLEGRTLLLFAEQGFGDTMMFIRYAKLAARRNGRVMVQCQPPLRRLLSAVPEIAHVSGEGDRLPHFDLQAPLMSLPRIFGSALDTEFNWEPYLHVPKGMRCVLPPHDARAFKVGLAWGSNPRHPIFAEKSLDLPFWERILRVPNCAFFSMQVDPSPVAQRFIEQTGLVQLIEPPFRDFAETAAALREMDLIISVDTAVAHLAGAMGRPVWLLLAYAADWRWLLRRKDSPWYPTMQLFRQPDRGNWKGAVREIASALEERVEAKPCQAASDSAN